MHALFYPLLNNEVFSQILHKHLFWGIINVLFTSFDELVEETEG